MISYFRSRPRKGFTFIEILIVVVIAGVMATFVMPNFSPMEDSTLVSVNRLLGEARNIATGGGNLILRVSAEKLELCDLSGNPISVKSELPQGRWSIRPGKFFFFRDGSCSPGRIVFNGNKGEEVFMVSVVCRAYQIEER